MKIAALTNIRI